MAKMGSAKTLLFLLLAAAILGALVLIFKKNYRIPYNMISNRDFYSVLSEK